LQNYNCVDKIIKPKNNLCNIKSLSKGNVHMDKKILEELVINLLSKNYLLKKDNKKLLERIEVMESSIKEENKTKLINGLSFH
jgi:hypothetical protein